jgi:hypothetical protein
VFLNANRAATGRHTGRDNIGALTTMPEITQLLPHPRFFGLWAERP